MSGHKNVPPTDHSVFLSFMHTREIYTTGQVAKILTVAPRTVSLWCDSGALQSYRLPPGKSGMAAGDRRITRAALIDFIHKHNLPEMGFDDVRPRALIASARADLARFMTDALPGCAFTVCGNIIGAAHALGESIYHVVVIDSQCGGIECGQLREMIEKLKWPPKVMAIAGEDAQTLPWIGPDDVTTVWPGPAEEAVRRFKEITKQAVQAGSKKFGRSGNGLRRTLDSIEGMDRVTTQGE